MADGIEAIGERQRILALVGQVDDGRAEQRPEFANLDAAAEPDFLAFTPMDVLNAVRRLAD